MRCNGFSKLFFIFLLFFVSEGYAVRVMSIIGLEPPVRACFRPMNPLDPNKYIEGKLSCSTEWIITLLNHSNLVQTGTIKLNNDFTRVTGVASKVAPPVAQASVNYFTYVCGAGTGSTKLSATGATSSGSFYQVSMPSGEAVFAIAANSIAQLFIGATVWNVSDLVDGDGFNQINTSFTVAASITINEDRGAVSGVFRTNNRAYNEPGNRLCVVPGPNITNNRPVWDYQAGQTMPINGGRPF